MGDIAKESVSIQRQSLVLLHLYLNFKISLTVLFLIAKKNFPLFSFVFKYSIASPSFRHNDPNSTFQIRIAMVTKTQKLVLFALTSLLLDMTIIRSVNGCNSFYPTNKSLPTVQGGER